MNSIAYGGDDGAHSRATISFTCQSNGVLTVNYAVASYHISGRPGMVLKNDGETVASFDYLSTPGILNGKSYNADEIYLEGGHYGISGTAKSIEGKVNCSMYVRPGKGSFYFSPGLCDINN